MALIKCKECGKEISASVKACPHCGKKHHNDLAATITVLAIIGIGCYLYYENSDGIDGAHSEATSVAPAPTRSLYTTTAMELNRDYGVNEVATDAKIGDAVIEISGVIQSIDKDFMDHAVILLATGNEFDAARLQLLDSEKAKAADLSIGQHIIARCDKMRRVMGSPAGTDCILRIP